MVGASPKDVLLTITTGSFTGVVPSEAARRVIDSGEMSFEVARDGSASGCLGEARGERVRPAAEVAVPDVNETP